MIPIVLLIAAGVVQIIIRYYLSSREKNKYIKFLTNNFPPVEEYSTSVFANKIVYTFFLSYISLVFGVGVGFIFELVLVTEIGKVFNYINDVNYIGNLLKISSDTALLNLTIMYFSSFNLGIVLVSVAYRFLVKYLNSKKLLGPKIDELGFPLASTYSVYASFRFIIGLLLGIYMFIIIVLVNIISKFSLFDRVKLNLFFTQIWYPEIHFIVLIVIFLIAFVVIAMSSYNARLIYEKITKLTTEFYMPKFPFIKIKNH